MRLIRKLRRLIAKRRPCELLRSILDQHHILEMETITPVDSSKWGTEEWDKFQDFVASRRPFEVRIGPWKFGVKGLTWAELQDLSKMQAADRSGLKWFAERLKPIGPQKRFIAMIPAYDLVTQYVDQTALADVLEQFWAWCLKKNLRMYHISPRQNPFRETAEQSTSSQPKRRSGVLQAFLVMDSNNTNGTIV